MARTSNDNQETNQTEEVINANSDAADLDLDKKVTVENIASWEVGFVRIDGVGDIRIVPNGSIRLSRNEIISQVQNGNKLFTGIDGLGSHATLYIADAATRRELDFDTPERTQKIFTIEKVKALCKISNRAHYESEFRDLVKTRAEKHAVIEAMRKLGINDYDRIKFAEAVTGYKFS